MSYLSMCSGIVSPRNSAYRLFFALPFSLFLSQFNPFPDRLPPFPLPLLCFIEAGGNDNREGSGGIGWQVVPRTSDLCESATLERRSLFYGISSITVIGAPGMRTECRLLPLMIRFASVIFASFSEVFGTCLSRGMEVLTMV